MSAFEQLQKTADDDARYVAGTEKPNTDSNIETNPELEMVRDHLDDVEDRNATTIQILDDTVVATESRDLSEREYSLLRTTLKAITGVQPFKVIAQEDDNAVPNRQLALEGFKETLKKFWTYIKEQAKKFWNLLKRWWFKTFDISKRAKSRAEKLMDRADREYGVSVENEIAFKEIKKLAMNGRITDPTAIVKGLKDLEELVGELIASREADLFNEAAQDLTDKTTEIIEGIKSHADALTKARGEDARIERSDLSIKESDMDEFIQIVETIFARSDSSLVDHRDFGLDKADKYLKQYGEVGKVSFRHSNHFPGDKWVLAIDPTISRNTGPVIDLGTTIEGVRASRMLVASCLYGDKQYDAEPLVKVLSTSLISRGCESIVRMCEYVNEYRIAFERRDRFKERVIKDIDQVVNNITQDNDMTYVECDRLIRSFANAIVGLIRRRSDFETSLCAYSMSTSIAFLNYSELSLKQYTK